MGAPRGSGAVPRFWQGQTPKTTLDPALAGDLCAMFSEIEGVGGPGEDPSRGYTRSAWTAQDLALRDWFARRAGSLGLRVGTDSAGNQWAWWDSPHGPRTAVTCGSHLDSVPSGGAFDGPLGVISALAAVASLQRRGLTPSCPLAIVNFSDEEGARFGIACVGSRVLTGVLDAERALGLVDAEGREAREILREAGQDLSAYGADPELLASIATHIELHVEQGRALADEGAPVGVATHIWPHGRWRIDIGGEANHAGTTPMGDRDDALVAAAALILRVREIALARGARLTVGRLGIEPGATNVIPSRVRLWVDARAGDSATLDAALADLAEWSPLNESLTPATSFDEDVRERLCAASTRVLGAATAEGTAAGHDSGILQDAGVPCGMIFVRNATGFSHTPREYATLADCTAGAAVLVETLEERTRAR